MLEKLAAVANFADQNGDYTVANDATKLIKEAQLWDAIRTLFDPEHTPGLDRSSKWLDRLSKGWGRGKMDRHLGLVLAIMSERTKLNNKIESLTAPIRLFQEQVSGFYEKIRSGAIKSDNIREESRALQSSLKDTLKLISGKELKQILKIRERLEVQQLQAAEKIKGLDDETKTNLMSVLRGENMPGSSPKGEAPGKPGDPDRMAKWMRGIGVAKSRSLHEGRKSKNINMFRPFVTEYQANPVMVLEFFNANPAALEKGFDLFGKDFANMYYWAENAVEKDREAATKEQVAPGAGATVAPAESPAKEEAKQEAKEEVKQEVKEKPPVVEPAAAPAEKVVEKLVEQLAPAPVAKPADKPKPNPRTQRHIDVAQEAQEAHKAKGKGKGKDKEKPAAPSGIVPAPIELREPAAVAKADDGQLNLAVSAAQRLERQITRLGRVQQLRKFADEITDVILNDGEAALKDGTEDEVELQLKNVEMELSGYDGQPLPGYSELKNLAKKLSEKLKELQGPDVYHPSVEREPFDEDIDYDPAQTGVDMYHGEFEDQAMRDDDNESTWGFRHDRVQKDTMNSLLSKMEQFGRLWREAPDEGAKALVQKQLDRLQAEYDLLKEKLAVEEEKKLPEGWADDE